MDNIDFKAALKAAEILKAYCNHFASCFDCPFNKRSYCRIKYPNTHDINFEDKRGADND